MRVASRVLGLALGVVLAVAAGRAAARLWQLDPRPVLVAEALLVALTAVVVAARPLWNPVGQVFFASFAAAALAYLSFATTVTFASGLAPAGVAASALLLVLETSALLLSGSFTFESCDVLCRVRWSRRPPLFDAAYRPKVSLHVPAYNEPPDMLIETIRSLDRLDYPNYEIVVVDNNTRDPAGIGIDPALRFAPLHTHDASGSSTSNRHRAHLHAGAVLRRVGVRFTRSCLGGYCAAGERRRLRLYVDGAAYRGDPTTLPLASPQYAAEIPGDLYTGPSPDAS